MRVAMWYNNRDVRLEEMPVAAIGPGGVLVRVDARGSCGGDVLVAVLAEGGDMLGGLGVEA